MSVSANALFHFTKKKHLINILKNNFIPHYSMEKIFVDELERAVPMVSFCDIPLSQVSEHINEYGRFAIGMKKEWGVRNKINPISYYHENSEVNKRLFSIFTLAHRDNFLNGADMALNDMVELYSTIQHLYYYAYFSKPYKGCNFDNKRMDWKKTPKILYNEREWRYIPHNDTDLGFGVLDRVGYIQLNDRSFRKTYSGNDTTLYFDPNDIKYIIVEKESDIKDLIESIKETKINKFGGSEIEVLISRIISVEQIKQDF